MKTEENPETMMANKSRLRWSAGLHVSQFPIIHVQVLFQIGTTPIFKGKRRNNEDWNTDQIVVKHCFRLAENGVTLEGIYCQNQRTG
jgi:hypothetical protein